MPGWPPRMTLHWRLLAIVIAVVGGRVSSAQVAGHCGDQARAWADGCARTVSRAVAPVFCLPDRLVVEVGIGELGPLRIEIATPSAGATVPRGRFGLTPVGDFADWGREPAPRRDALDAIAACVERDPSLLEAIARDAAAAPDPSPSVSWTWDAWGTWRSWLGGVLLGVLGLPVALAIAVLAFRRRDAIAHGVSALSRRWRNGPLSIVVLAVLLAALETWAARAADPDFFIPDPFHGLVVTLLLVYLVAGFCPWGQLRRALLTVVLAVPLLVLALEVYFAERDVGVAATRIVASDDRLLRYTYRPGAVLRDAGGDMPVTDDGLWDRAHAIQKPPDVDRVVVLGDSVPNDPSIPYADRFPRGLEAELAMHAPAGRRVEVLNVSCEGYNTIQEVRLLERVGLKYRPDVVVVAYVLNDPYLQNGAYRRFGNSYFAFRVAQAFGALSGRTCAMFAPLYGGYNFDLVVRASFERLRLLSERDGFGVLVAPLPIMVPFDDTACTALYDQVIDVARAQGFLTWRVVDAFRGLDHHRFLKPDRPSDITHPNADGHARIARGLAGPIAARLWPAVPGVGRAATGARQDQ
jgi:GDSL-like lipase/acylhydrolase family protein